MPIENPIPPFIEWLLPTLAYWCAVVGSFSLGLLLLTFIVGAVLQGPRASARNMFRGLLDATRDVLRMSPRRVLALAWLAAKEALRREAWVALALFLVILAFAGWFLEPRQGGDPTRLYISFVLTATTMLMLLLALFMSAFSLPNDISKRTIFTIVTKPVRPSEIVAGRIVGFMAVGSGLLVVMCVLSCIFVERQLAHGHVIDARDVQVDESSGARRGKTSTDSGHQHEFTVDAQGNGQTDLIAGHWHVVTAEQDGDQTVYRVGPPEDTPLARVPVYGKLRFKDPAGVDTNRGTNVGDEWTYRQFVEGGTAAAAIWRFSGITEDRFPDGLPVQMTMEIYRTYKGDVNKGIPGELVLRNPTTGLEHVASIFTPREHTVYTEFVPRQLVDALSSRSVDLFKDLVDDGNLEMQIRCVPPGQYYGVAQADVYLVARRASFRVNFVKGYLGIWLQMLIITGFGVMFSTFLNGPVAMLATLATLAGGYFVPFIRDLASGKLLGGGPAESFLRLITQKDMMSELDPSTGVTVANTMDVAFQIVLTVVSSLLPSLPQFSDVDWVANGFDIPLNNLAVHFVAALAYLAPVFLVGHMFLKSREVAK